MVYFIVRLHWFRSLIDFIACVLCLVQKDLLDKLSLPILPVQCFTTLSAMNTPMASGRKDAPWIDAALVSCIARVQCSIPPIDSTELMRCCLSRHQAKYRGGWRLTCDTCLALYIPEAYIGPNQMIPVAKMKALGLNKNYLTLVKLVE